MPGAATGRQKALPPQLALVGLAWPAGEQQRQGRRAKGNATLAAPPQHLQIISFSSLPAHFAGINVR